jgi:hypothetical protein
MGVVFLGDFWGLWGTPLLGCREKEAGVEDFPYGLSVESFFPRRRANRTMPGERSLGLKRTLRK